MRDVSKAPVAELPEFDRSLPMLLIRALETTRRQFRPVFSGAGITEAQWRVLRALADVDCAAVSDVAARCALQLPSMTRIIRHLDESGLLNRTSDPDDHRRTLLSITDAGRAQVHAMSPAITAVYGRLDRALGDRSVASLAHHLSTLVADLADCAHAEEVA